MEEKKYVNGVLIKEKTFDNGGSQLKMSIKVEDFMAEIKSIEDNGWANLIVSKRKEPSDKGVTHYVKVDTWKPDSSKAKQTVSQGSSNTDDLPF
mgnify:FL=1